MYEFVKLKGADAGLPVGFDVVVDGTVPTGPYLIHSVEFPTVFNDDVPILA